MKVLVIVMEKVWSCLRCEVHCRIFEIEPGIGFLMRIMKTLKFRIRIKFFYVFSENYEHFRLEHLIFNKLHSHYFALKC